MQGLAGRYTRPRQRADCLYKQAHEHLPSHNIRTDDTNGDLVFESDFYILKNTYCAAVLIENGFMDCVILRAYLESDAGKKDITAIHVDGIIDFCEKRKNEPL